jgi:hypothetical protein
MYILLTLLLTATKDRQFVHAATAKVFIGYNKNSR